MRRCQRTLDCASCGGRVAAHELRAAVDHHLRGVDAFGPEARLIELLPPGQRGRREPILPAKAIPVVDVLAEADDFGATDRLRPDQLAEHRVGRRTVRTTFGSEQLDEDGHRRCGVAVVRGESQDEKHDGDDDSRGEQQG